MQELLRILMRHPEVAIIAIIWIVGAVASVMQKAKKARESRQRRESLPTMDVPPAPRPVPPPSPRPQPATRSDPEAVAREMRRILGMEPAAGDAGQSTEPEPVLRRAPSAPPSAPRPRPRVHDEASPERAPTPLSTTTDRQRLQIHVDPHVGDTIRRRSTPASGAIGAQALGTLGGRTGETGRGRRRDPSRLVDLHDLKRALVLREIFDAPLALRDRVPGAD